MFKNVLILSLSIFVLKALVAKIDQSNQASKQKVITKIVTEAVNTSSRCGGKCEKR